MAKTIRVSDAVYQELQKRGKVFEDTPDRVLRRILGLPEDDLGAARGGAAVSGRQSQDASLLALLGAGLIKAGEEIVFDRPRKGESFAAVITEDGRVVLEDGRSFATLSGAADTCADGVPQNGWASWQTKKDRTRLSELRAQFREKR